MSKFKKNGVSLYSDALSSHLI